MEEYNTPPPEDKDAPSAPIKRTKQAQTLRVICNEGHTLGTVLVEDQGRVKKCVQCGARIKHYITKGGVKVRW